LTNQRKHVGPDAQHSWSPVKKPDLSAGWFDQILNRVADAYPELIFSGMFKRPISGAFAAPMR